MKKTTLFALLATTLSFAQSTTFVKKYDSYMIERDYVKEPRKIGEVTVVFNSDEKQDIVFYYTNGSTKTYHQITGAVEGKTTNGDGYQTIDCIDSLTGKRVTLQLFDDDTCLRLFVAPGNFIEMHND